MRYLALQLKYTTPLVPVYCHGHKVETLDLVFCFGGNHKPQSLAFYKESFSTRTIDQRAARLWIEEAPVCLVLEPTSPVKSLIEQLLGVSLSAASDAASPFLLEPGDEVLRISIAGQPDSEPLSPVQLAEALSNSPSRVHWQIHTLKRDCGANTVSLPRQSP